MGRCLTKHVNFSSFCHVAEIHKLCGGMHMVMRMTLLSRHRGVIPDTCIDVYRDKSDGRYISGKTLRKKKRASHHAGKMVAGIHKLPPRK